MPAIPLVMGPPFGMPLPQGRGHPMMMMPRMPMPPQIMGMSGRGR